MWNNLALFVLMGFAAAFDWRSRRIPNLLIAIGFVMVLLLGLMSLGPSWTERAIGLALALLIGLPCYIKRWFGAGDIKLALLMGALMGGQAIVWILLFTMVAGGIVALVVERLQPKQGVPYAVAMALGALAYVLWSSTQL